MDIKKRIQELSLDQKAKLYFMGLVRQGKIDRLPEDPKAAYVSMMMNKENKKPNLKSIADVDRSGWTPDGGGGSIGYMEWEDGTEMTPQEIQDYFEVNHELYDDIMQGLYKRSSTTPKTNDGKFTDNLEKEIKDKFGEYGSVSERKPGIYRIKFSYMRREFTDKVWDEMLKFIEDKGFEIDQEMTDNYYEPNYDREEPAEAVPMIHFSTEEQDDFEKGFKNE